MLTGLDELVDVCVVDEGITRQDPIMRKAIVNTIARFALNTLVLSQV